MLDLINTRICESCLGWDVDIPGSNGATYKVKWERMPAHMPHEYGWTCSCPAFQFRGECKHIGIAKEKVCHWGMNAFSGSFHETESDCCPKCSGSLVTIKVGV